MKFFLDTAKLSQVKEAAEWGLVDGVTTNPSLMAKENIEDYAAHYVALCRAQSGDVSAEVIATDYEGMLREARQLAALHERIVVKIPMTRDGVKAIRALADEGIKTNCTLVFTAAQAMLAAKAGAAYVSPFIGRLDDHGHDGMALIRQIRQIFDNYLIETEILAASIRHTRHVIECMEAGADVATLPFSVLMGLFDHPLTDAGLAKFLADHAAAKK
ncbi:MAG: fructose-6-phosphate aldolase [Bacteroidia bacterium]|nr:fructose-6-phosphate aldolase [Bacteroidia bacterium]